MSDVEPVYITVHGDDVTFSPETSRSKMLMLAFYAVMSAKGVKLDSGVYRFNSFRKNEVNVTTFDTVVGSGKHIKYRRCIGSGVNTVEFEQTNEPRVSSSSYDWLNPWNFFKFMAFVAFMVAWAWAFFD